MCVLQRVDDYYDDCALSAGISIIAVNFSLCNICCGRELWRRVDEVSRKFEIFPFFKDADPLTFPRYLHLNTHLIIML